MDQLEDVHNFAFGNLPSGFLFFSFHDIDGDIDIILCVLSGISVISKLIFCILCELNILILWDRHLLFNVY